MCVGPYRAVRPDGSRERLPAPRDPMRSPRVRAWGALALSAASGAAAIGSLELAVLAGVGALGAALHALRARRRRRSHHGLVRFLGSEDVRPVAEGVASLDGRRRARRSIAEGVVRYEVLSADGRRTLESYRASDAETAPRAALPEEVRFVSLHGRCLSPVCFDGPPPGLGGPVRRREPGWLRVSRYADGVLLERLDPDGVVLGDTWHPDLDAASEQVRAEYGPHAGPLVSRPPPRDLPSAWR